MTEGESLVGGAKASGGSVWIQEPLAGANGLAHLFWQPTKDDQWLEIPFEVKETGVYSFMIVATKSWDYGIYEYQVDGKPLGKPVDQYDNVVSFEEVNLGRKHLSAGRHVLRVENKGKNPASDGYYFGLDAILASPDSSTD